jgi:dTMP kinase
LALDRIACGGLTPDLTLLIDVDLDTGLERMRTRNSGAPDTETRMDEQSIEFHNKVRDAYLAIAKQYAGRFRIVDGRGSPETVAAKVWETLGPDV